MMRAYLRLLGTPLAISEAALQNIVDIARRENESLEAVAAKMGRELDNTYEVEMRGTVAVLPVQGPMIRYANLFSAVSGATSYERLATDFNEALNNDDVSAIVLNIDSPGGEVTGVSELADMIYAARGVKPVMAYVGGMACSAAYWLAAAADEIVCADTAMIGCIGVRSVIRDTSDQEAKNGIKTYSFVSSQTPNKNAHPSTETGAAQIQALVDASAQVMMEKIAQYRGEDVDKVISDFGKGATLAARQAVADGLVDRIGSFESVISELSATGLIGMPATRGLGAISTSEGNAMKIYLTNKAPAAGDTASAEATAASIQQYCPDVAAALRAEGATAGVTQGREEAEKAHTAALPQVKAETVTAERARFVAIMGHAEAKGREGAAVRLATTTDMTVDAAGEFLKSLPKGNNGVAFAAAMAAEAVPPVGADAPAAGDDVGAWAAGLVKLAEDTGVIRN